MIVKLTPDFIENHLVCPEGKRRIEFVDEKRTGLYVEVRATGPGRGTYYLRYKDADGKTCHVKVGDTTTVDVDEARLRAKKLKAEITLGKDPATEKKALQSAPTLDDFFEVHYMPHCRSHNRGAAKKEQMYNLRLREAFGRKRLDQIKRHEVTAWHVGLREDGLSPASADRFLALLRHALNMAVEWEVLEKNPASRIKLFNPDNRVERYLDPDELQRLLTVLRTGSARNFTVRMLALFLLSTGARLNEALRSRWEDVDRVNRVWRIPASSSKSKTARSVLLNDSAVEVLDRLGTEGKFDWLFVNLAKGERLKYVHRVWWRLRAKADLPHLRIHDLRHQHASFLVNRGHSLYVVQQILGHSDPSVTQRYAHLSTKSLRDASDCVSEVIEDAMKESA